MKRAHRLGIAFRALSSIRLRLVVLVVVAALPAVALLVASQLRERQSRQEATESDAMILSNLAAARFSESREGARQLLRGISALEDEGCDEQMAAILHQFPQYTSLFIARWDGRIQCSGSPLGSGVSSIADRPYFIHAIASRGMTESEFSFGRMSG